MHNKLGRQKAHRHSSSAGSSEFMTLPKSKMWKTTLIPKIFSVGRKVYTVPAQLRRIGLLLGIFCNIATPFLAKTKVIPLVRIAEI